MFDYQAGEKYKLTLIMVGVAGLMAGMFFSLLLMPPSEAPAKRKAAMARHMSDPDVTGVRQGATAGGSAGSGAAQATGASAQMVDPYQAKVLIDRWLPLAWDLSAGSAKNSQEQAISVMTPECADAYRKDIWTPQLSQQIEEAGLRSSFQPKDVKVGEPLTDGSIEIKVSGTQSLGAPGKGGKTRDVHLVYLIRQTPSGMRIAGISEGG